LTDKGKGKGFLIPCPLPLIYFTCITVLEMLPFGKKNIVMLEIR
jgi:hypothetical protein